MTQKLLLIDFENVQQVDLGRLDDACQVMIFVGASQKSVPIDLVTAAQKLGARVANRLVSEMNSTITYEFD